VAGRPGGVGGGGVVFQRKQFEVLPESKYNDLKSTVSLCFLGDFNFSGQFLCGHLL
jgi:hypothetical protein